MSDPKAMYYAVAIILPPCTIAKNLEPFTTAQYGSQMVCTTGGLHHAKFGMSMCVLGMAQELKNKGIAVNALLPRTTIATAAVINLLGGEEIVRASRKPEIMADAAHAILTKSSRQCTGNFFY